MCCQRDKVMSLICERINWSQVQIMDLPWPWFLVCLKRTITHGLYQAGKCLFFGCFPLVWACFMSGLTAGNNCLTKHLSNSVTTSPRAGGQRRRGTFIGKKRGFLCVILSCVSWRCFRWPDLVLPYYLKKVTIWQKYCQSDNKFYSLLE